MAKIEMAPHELSIDSIDPDPKQPRRKFEGLQELSTVIGSIGVLQPILVRPHPTEAGRWMIIIGERRWRAAKLAGLATIPVFNRGAIPDARVFFMQIVENLEDYRHPLEAHEKAIALKSYVADVGVEEACKVFGKKKDWISRETALAEVSAEVWAVAEVEKIQDKRTILELNRLCKHTGKQPDEEWKGLKQIGPKSREALHSRMVASGVKKPRAKKEEGSESLPEKSSNSGDGGAQLANPGTPIQIVPQARPEPQGAALAPADGPVQQSGRFKRQGLASKVKRAGEVLGINADLDFEALLEKLLKLAVPEVEQIDDQVP